MKKLILNLCRWALAALGVTGMISCDGDSDFLPAPEYGCPMMNFRVQGKVLSSETDKPVKGIAVIAIIDHHTYESQDTVWTADNGEFVCKDYASPSESVILKFTDVDGADNGGEFRTKKVEVPLTKQLEAGEDWNIGAYTAEDVAVELEPVVPAEE